MRTPSAIVIVLAALVATAACGPPDRRPASGADARGGLGADGAAMGDGLAAAKRVFVSSASYSGNLGGLAGADADCQMVASAAALSGTYKAWLSSSVTSAAARLTHSPNPYVLVDGTVIATSWNALTTPPLAHPPDEDEHGAITHATPGFIAWSDSQADGSPTSDPCARCNDWIALTSDVCPFQSNTMWYGGIGDASMTSSSWTAGTAQASCTNSLYPLYCIEQ